MLNKPVLTLGIGMSVGIGVAGLFAFYFTSRAKEADRPVPEQRLPVSVPTRFIPAQTLSLSDAQNHVIGQLQVLGDEFVLTLPARKGIAAQLDIQPTEMWSLDLYRTNAIAVNLRAYPEGVRATVGRNASMIKTSQRFGSRYSVNAELKT